MKPEKILKRAQNPDNIPGIYNYCDRWCERCTFTSRCLNRELSAEREKNLQNLDITNKQYWEEVGAIFTDTIELVKHVSEKMGIDWREVEKEMRDDVAGKKDSIEGARHHIISIEAKKYIDMTECFFEKKKIFEEKQNEMNLQLQLGINERKIQTEAEELKDVYEILQWYNPQIWVKLMRALSGKSEGEEWQEENGFQKDSDGSAKVALIGIDRSMAAWGKMFKLFEEQTDDFISILLHLEKLRQRVELEFPNARNFIRPGFDEKV